MPVPDPPLPDAEETPTLPDPPGTMPDGRPLDPPVPLPGEPPAPAPPPPLAPPAGT